MNFALDRLLQSVLICGAMLATSSVLAAEPPQSSSWKSTLKARDINRDGTIDAYYEKSTNLTWMAAPVLLESQGGPYNEPYVLAPEQLGAYSLYGVSGWRLPKATIAGLFEYFEPLRETYCDEYGCMTLPVSAYCDEGRCEYQPTAASGELAHLFITTLNNTPGGGTRNPGPFQNFVDLTSEHWAMPYGTALNVDGFGGVVWFSTSAIWHYVEEEAVPFSPMPAVGPHYYRPVWAVRDGDVVGAIPEPETYALMLAGLAAIGVMTRLRRKAGSAHG